MDEDSASASAYETSSEDGQGSSHNEKLRSSSRAVSRSRISSMKASSSGVNDYPLIENFTTRASSISSEETQRIREDAVHWASNFREPQSSHDIKSPRRHPFGARALRKIEKRKAERSASDLRAKRLKGFHSSEYRDLLNVEICDASARTIPEDYIPLDGSQIGSSIWKPKEKEEFFSALSRLGKDNVSEIALRIGTKSEVEVQEYVHLLHQATEERNLEDIKNHPETGYQQLVAFTDHPAAFEISEECCISLERAGDAVSNRLESYEEQEEEAKWGDFWLLNANISKLFENKAKSENGEKEIEEILPSANFLNLKNWLGLSRRIFMNPAAPQEEDNWQNLAENGETPAIRATAFEDFHSLAVSITKRLVSTTLFQTMTRLRVTNANKIKHAQISLRDVDAAVRMLGMKSNSNEFWRGCPRRCTLDVFDDSHSNSSIYKMSYDEVEKALEKNVRAQSRSRSQSVNQLKDLSRSFSSADNTIDSEGLTDSLSEIQESDFSDKSTHSQQLEPDLEDYDSLENSDDEFTDSNKRRGESRKNRIEELKAHKRAQEEYTQAFDEEANRLEEHRLWALLHQDPPFEIKPEPIEPPDRPRNIREETGYPEWRDNLEYWSQWETLPSPVLADSFARNRQRRSENVWRRVYRTRSGSNLCLRRTASVDIETSQYELGKDRSGIRYDYTDQIPNGSEDIPEQSLNESDDGSLADPEEWTRTLRSPSSGVDAFSEAKVAVKSEDDN